MLEVACWPAAGGERRRYAGISHIDVSKLDPAKVRDVLDRHGLEISSLAYYPNNLHPDPGAAGGEHAPAEGDRRGGEARRADGRHLRRARPDEERPGQPPRVPQGLAPARRPRRVTRREDRDRELPDDLLARRVAGRHEPGATPAVWDEMFAIVDSPSFGLNLDPSHLVWLMIDSERVVRDYAAKIFHVHAKDLEIDRDGLYRTGRSHSAWAGRCRGSRAGRGALGPLHRGALPGGLRRRRLGRARGPDVRGHRGARQARLPDLPRHPQAAAALAQGDATRLARSGRESRRGWGAPPGPWTVSGRRSRTARTPAAEDGRPSPTWSYDLVRRGRPHKPHG